jgi:hypothetical protein
MILNENVTWRGDVYRGNYLRGPSLSTLLQSNVEVTIVKFYIINYLQEVFNTEQSLELEYVAFGTKEEVYLAHTVANVVDYISIVKLDIQASTNLIEVGIISIMQ